MPIMMRHRLNREVKLGFAIGGVLLAVIVVYVVAVGGGGKDGTSTESCGSRSGDNHATADSTPRAITPAPEALNTDKPPAPVADTPPVGASHESAVAKSNESTASAGAQSGGDWDKLLNGASGDQALVLM